MSVESRPARAGLTAHEALWIFGESVVIALCLLVVEHIALTGCACDVPTVGARLYSTTPGTIPRATIGYLRDDHAPQLQFIVRPSKRAMHLGFEVTDLRGADSCSRRNAITGEKTVTLGPDTNVPNGLATAYRSRSLSLVKIRTVPNAVTEVTCIF